LEVIGVFSVLCRTRRLASSFLATRLIPWIRWGWRFSKKLWAMKTKPAHDDNAVGRTSCCKNGQTDVAFHAMFGPTERSVTDVHSSSHRLVLQRPHCVNA